MCISGNGGYTSHVFISKNGGLYSLDQNSQRKPFVFGKPLVDDSRKAPYAHSGLAAINARCGSNEAVLARNYRELVDRVVKNMGARAKAHLVKLDSAGAFVEELKRELMDKNERPHPGFIWDLASAKHASIFPIFIYDVASALGVPAGVAIGTGEISLYVCKEGVRVKDAHLKIGEKLESDKDANAPVYDKSELQSSIYSIAALEKFYDGDCASALELYRKALSVCPENANARCGAASVLVELGKYPGALVESEAAISLEPRLGEAHNLSGVALASMKRDYDAIERYMDAIEFASTREKRATYHYNAALSYLSVGQLNDAKNSCDRCIAIEKDNADAFKLRSAICRELGMNRQADEDMRRYNELTGGKGGQ